MFKSFWIAGGDFLRMEIIMTVTQKKSVKTRETERGFTRSQLADHYKMPEDSQFIKELIARLNNVAADVAALLCCCCCC